MNRYRDYGRNDDVPELLGDRAFLRLDMQSDPATLPEGTVQVSENFRFETSGAKVRGGIARQLASGDTVDAIYWAGVYRPDGSNDRIAMVNGARLTLFNPADQSTVRYNYPAGETVTAEDELDLIQGGVSSGTTPDLYILRGHGKSVLKFNGSTVAVAASFTPGEFGIFYQDRMAVNADSWTVKWSDFLDFTTWSNLAQHQVLKGSDDYLTLFLPFQKDYVLVGSRKRWFIAHIDPLVAQSIGTGYSAGLQDTSFLRELTRQAGPVGKCAALDANGKIWFITDHAVYAFIPRLDLELTVLGEPVSTPIQPIMNRLSTDFARSCSIRTLGHRLYFAMPISGVPVRVSSVIIGAETTGIELPFDLPAVLGGGHIVTLETESDHDLANGDLIELRGALDTGLNGRRRLVTSVTSSRQFTIDIDDSTGLGLGERCYVQKLAERNNLIAIYNLARDAWESIDVLPSGVFADHLVVADAFGQRRLWLVDRELGPNLYEEGETDEITDEIGGLSLPFDLPAELSLANFGSVPIAGRLRQRALQWGSLARQVKAGHARASLANDDAGTLTLTVRTPGRDPYEGTTTFSGLTEDDKPVRKKCGRRGLEAELELTTTGGRPAVRSLIVEVAASGRDSED